MKNQEIADIFTRMADLIDILGQDSFRAISYRKAARVLEEHTQPLEQVATAKELMEIPGIGKGTAEKILQYLAEGKITAYEELKAEVPPHLPELLDISGLGPKTVAKLWKHGNIASVGDLKKAIAGDRARLTSIEGFGEKKVQQIADSLAFKELSGGRILLGDADELAAALVETVLACPGARRVLPAGSLRRGKETIGDIDLLCEASAAEAPAIIAAFDAAPNVVRVLSKGETKGSVVLANNVQADLRVVEKESFGAALAYFTGSKEHNVRLREIAVKKGLKLNEYGLFKGDKAIAGADEEGIYSALGLAYVPPEMRENRGEVELAAQGKLPKLVELGDICGDLHMHTVASDGTNTIEEMINACRARGYKYMAISDHSKSQVQARGLDEKRLSEHAAEIRRIAARYSDILVLVSAEVDIFKDGTLDFDAGVLAELDIVTASAHSALTLGREEATRRFIKAIETPHVHCIGHLTGRLINQRPGMKVDIDAIASAAAANNVALEINAHPMRLDLRDVHVHAAIQKGAKIIINCDAHAVSQLDYMKYGVQTARRGWATAADVMNTLPAAKLKKWLEQKR